MKDEIEGNIESIEGIEKKSDEVRRKIVWRIEEVLDKGLIEGFKVKKLSDEGNGVKSNEIKRKWIMKGDIEIVEELMLEKRNRWNEELERRKIEGRNVEKKMSEIVMIKLNGNEIRVEVIRKKKIEEEKKWLGRKYKKLEEWKIVKNSRKIGRKKRNYLYN